MAQIQIHEAEIALNRPCTLELSGYIGQNRFFADLEGVCLSIKTSHSLNSSEERRLEEKLQELFLLELDGSFNEKEISEIMEEAPFMFKV